MPTSRWSISIVNDCHQEQATKRNVCLMSIQTIENLHQQQRDLLIAKQRKEEIEMQNEAALRIAKQQQELKLERLQEEQELLRMRTDRLKKGKAL